MWRDKFATRPNMKLSNQMSLPRRDSASLGVMFPHGGKKSEQDSDKPDPKKKRPTDCRRQTYLLGIQLVGRMQKQGWRKTPILQQRSSRLCILQKGGTWLSDVSKCQKAGWKCSQQLTGKRFATEEAKFFTKSFSERKWGTSYWFKLIATDDSFWNRMDEFNNTWCRKCWKDLQRRNRSGRGHQCRWSTTDRWIQHWRSQQFSRFFNKNRIRKSYLHWNIFWFREAHGFHKEGGHESSGSWQVQQQDIWPGDYSGPHCWRWHCFPWKFHWIREIKHYVGAFGTALRYKLGSKEQEASGFGIGRIHAAETTSQSAISNGAPWIEGPWCSKGEIS